MIQVEVSGNEKEKSEEVTIGSMAAPVNMETMGSTKETAARLLCSENPDTSAERQNKKDYNPPPEGTTFANVLRDSPRQQVNPNAKNVTAVTKRVLEHSKKNVSSQDGNAKIPAKKAWPYMKEALIVHPVGATPKSKVSVWSCQRQIKMAPLHRSLYNYRKKFDITI